MGSRLLSELGQDSFEPHEYVERLAWRATSAQNSTGITVGNQGSGLGLVSQQNSHIETQERSRGQRYRTNNLTQGNEL